MNRANHAVKTFCAYYAIYPIAPENGLCFMMRMNSKTFIDQLGGIAAVAQATGASKSAVSNWRLTGRAVPWKHRPALARMATEKALPLPAGYWGEAV